MAKSPLGIDIGGVDDIDPTLNFVDGATAAAQSVMTDLLHDPGALWWSPAKGKDIRDYLHMPFDKENIERDIVRQAEMDERVDKATCEASERIENGQRVFEFRCNLELTNNSGNVDFTLAVNQAGDVINASVT
jgi:hypothetical protein